jgi:glycosyltransferase involved in cell wall biosynthesis
VLNYVDPDVFHSGAPRPSSKAPVVLFPGGLQWHQGVDIAIRAFVKLRERLPAAQFHIYGDGSMKRQLIELTHCLDLDGSVRFFEPLDIRRIADVMAGADLGVVPKRADSFGNEAFSTKIMEFMAVGVPLVVSDTKVDRYYFDESVVRFFESGNADHLAQAMFEVLTDEALRSRMVRSASDYVARNSWDRHRQRYLSLVDSLIPA